MTTMLSDVGGGLLQTHVHWKDLELALQQAFHTEATFGPDKKVEDIGARNGVLSKICLITADWQHGSHELPNKFVAKICSPLAMIDHMGRTGGNIPIEYLKKEGENICLRVHNEELKCYEILNKYVKDRIPLPTIYASKKFTEDNKTHGFIIMNYIENLVPVFVADNIGIDQMKQIIKYIAIWQGMGTRLTEEERDNFRTDLFSTTFGKMFSPQAIQRRFEDTHQRYDYKLKKEIDILEEGKLDILSFDALKRLDDLSIHLGMKSKVFCHGDLWSPNILWTSDQSGFVPQCIIDFQTAHFGCPAADLSRVICSNMSGIDRRRHWKELLEFFYKQLQQEVDGQMPYSYEQLEESYLRFVPFAGFILLPAAGQYIDFLTASTDPTAEKKICNLKEKMELLIEDMTMCYQRTSH